MNRCLGCEKPIAPGALLTLCPRCQSEVESDIVLQELARMYEAQYPGTKPYEAMMKRVAAEQEERDKAPAIFVRSDVKLLTQMLIHAFGPAGELPFPVDMKDIERGIRAYYPNTYLRPTPVCWAQAVNAFNQRMAEDLDIIMAELGDE